MSPIVIRERFVPGEQCPAEARRSLGGFEGMVPTETLDHLTMLVSELVTNSVAHAGFARDQEIGLLVVLSRSSLSVEVRGGGPGFESPRPVPRPEPGETGGWGLYLVDALSESWESYHDGEFAVVWFELAC